MKKAFVYIAIIVLLIFCFIAAAGIYKFNYLSGKPGYDVDGNKIEQSQ